MKLDVCSRQIVGRRERQEDHCAVLTFRGMFNRYYALIVADGMGGHAGGEVASKLACKAVADTLERSRDQIPRTLKQALNGADSAIEAHINKEPKLDGMGTTLIAAVVAKSNLYWLSVGDSHLYRVRDGRLSKLNADHSMAPVLDQLAAEGEMTREDAAKDPRRHLLRSALSGEGVDLYEIEALEGDARPNDLFLLATDGVDTLHPDEICEIAVRHKSAGDIAESLVKAVESKGAPEQDNATVIVARVLK